MLWQTRGISEFHGGPHSSLSARTEPWTTPQPQEVLMGGAWGRGVPRKKQRINRPTDDAERKKPSRAPCLHLRRVCINFWMTYPKLVKEPWRVKNIPNLSDHHRRNLISLKRALAPPSESWLGDKVLWLCRQEYLSLCSLLRLRQHFFIFWGTNKRGWEREGIKEYHESTYNTIWKIK